MILSVSVSALFGQEGGTVGFAATCRDITESRLHAEQLRERNDQLIVRDHQMRALLTRLNEIREEERKRISGEVHDELGQLLTGVKMDLRWVKRRIDPEAVPGAEPLLSRLDEAVTLVDRTISTVQRIAVELRPSALDALGLQPAIRDEARRFERKFNVKVELALADTSSVPDDVATALFRILQELLTNVVRHAQASSVEISLTLEDDTWDLTVKDNGIGMAAIPAHQKSLGMLSMRERAESLAGSFIVESSTSGGTTARISIPFHQN